MRKAFLILVALMIYAVWAMAQSSPKFTAIPPGVTLRMETPGPKGTPTAPQPKAGFSPFKMPDGNYTYVRMPSPEPTAPPLPPPPEVVR